MNISTVHINSLEHKIAETYWTEVRETYSSNKMTLSAPAGDCVWWSRPCLSGQNNLLPQCVCESGRPCWKADHLHVLTQTSPRVCLSLSLILISPCSQFIHPTSVCLVLVSVLEHSCPDAKVSGQGDKLKLLHTHKHPHTLIYRVKLERPQPSGKTHCRHCTGEEEPVSTGVLVAKCSRSIGQYCCNVPP